MGKKKEGKEIVKAQNNTPAAVIAYAIAKGESIEKLEKILALQERYDANEAKKAYNVAMADFKTNPPKIDKDRKVEIQHKTGPGKTKYNHASLYNVTEKISAALSKHGLSASWSTKQNGAVVVTCKITHKQGHSEETTLQAPADITGSKNAIQAIGSTITYLERYTLLALTGLATFDDDDGSATGGEVECISDKQHSELIDLIVDSKADEGKFCKAFGVEEVSKMPKAKYNQAILALNAKKAGKLGTK